jgi:hypothetical protein
LEQAAASYNKQYGQDSLVMAEADKNILRGLARQVAQLAARPSEADKRLLWTRHNRLEATRPVIFCDPENGWNEIITAEQMLCSGELARAWEMRLRKEIFWGTNMGDDRVTEPYFDIGHVYTESDWGMHETFIQKDKAGAYTWDAPLKDYADAARLKFPVITVNREQTARLLSLAQEVLGDILTVRLKTAWWWTLGMTWTLVGLRGLEQVMFDLYDYPDELHRFMAFLRDGHLAKLDYLEHASLLSLNNDGTYVGSGGFGYSDELPGAGFAGSVRTRDMWGFCESQETSQVSAAMFEEFIFAYQLPILDRFGLNCYGCCEPLDKRWHVIRKAPRLRRVSVSAWADPSAMVDYLTDQYIYSLKPNPAYLAVKPMDEAYIRGYLRDIIRKTHGCRLEIIMKDNHTIANTPANVIRWCAIAREEAENAG